MGIFGWCGAAIVVALWLGRTRFSKNEDYLEMFVDAVENMTRVNAGSSLKEVSALTRRSLRAVEAHMLTAMVDEHDIGDKARYIVDEMYEVAMDAHRLATQSRTMFSTFSISLKHAVEDYVESGVTQLVADLLEMETQIVELQDSLRRLQGFFYVFCVINAQV